MSHDKTAEQKIRKLLNEEKIIVDLELAVKKAKFQKENESKMDDWNWKKK